MARKKKNNRQAPCKAPGRTNDTQDGRRQVDVARLLAKLESRIKVIHGVNDDTFDGLVGRSVVAVKEALTEAFGIPADAASFVNGERVGGDYILKTDDVLEFIRTTGVRPT